MTLQAGVAIACPREIVWKIFCNPKSWESWWGGALLEVEPGWQENANVRWKLGAPSRVVAYRSGVQVSLLSQPSSIKSTFIFIDVENGSTLVIYEEDYHAASVQVTNAAAKQAQCEATLADFKRYVEEHTWEYIAPVALKNLPEPAPTAPPAAPEALSNPAPEIALPAAPPEPEASLPVNPPAPAAGRRTPLSPGGLVLSAAILLLGLVILITLFFFWSRNIP